MYGLFSATLAVELLTELLVVTVRGVPTLPLLSFATTLSFTALNLPTFLSVSSTLVIRFLEGACSVFLSPRRSFISALCSGCLNVSDITDISFLIPFKTSITGVSFETPVSFDSISSNFIIYNKYLL